MKNKLSNEYAEALFELALEDAKADIYFDDLKVVKALLLDNAEYVEFLSSPSIPTEDKLRAIDEAFDGRIGDNTVSFLKLLCERGRAGLFFACFDDFERLYNEHKRVMLVKVTSATELTDSEKARLIKALKKKYALEIELECVVDKSILGGIIVEADGSVIDGSISKKLRDVKEVIKA